MLLVLVNPTGSERGSQMMSVEQDLAPQSAACRAKDGLIKEAERELSAFLTAVTEVHGPQCATTAAKHWMQAFEDICMPNLASKECFRRVTFAAVATLYHCIMRSTILTAENSCHEFSLP